MSEGGYWAVLTAPILECREVSDGAKLFYAQLSRYTNRLGYCWASNRTLSEELGTSERTISRYVAELEAAHFVSTEQVGVSDRKRRHERRIRLAAPAPFDVDKNGELNVDKNGELNVDKNGEPIKENNKSKNKTPKAPKGGDSALLFDRFWALYPKKKDKATARRAWNKLAPDILLCSQMSIALKAQMASEEWQKENGKYIPYPSKWLSHRRWEDELPDAPAKAKTGPQAKRWVGTQIIDGREVDVFE